MIRTEKMSHVVMFAPKTYKEQIIQKLYGLGVYHIKPHQKTEQVDIGQPLQEAEQFSQLLVKIRSLLTTLKVDKQKLLDSIKVNSEKRKKDHKLTARDRQELTKKLNHLYEKTIKIIEEKKEKENKIREAKEKNKLLNILRHLQLTKDLLRESNYLEHFIGSIEEADEFKERLTNLTTRAACKFTKSEGESGKQLIALYIEKNSPKRASVLELLNKHGFSEIDVSQVLDRTGKGNIKDMQHYAQQLHQQVSKETKQMHGLQIQLNTLRREYGHFLLKMEDLLQKETVKAEIPLQFGETSRSFTIEGWIPTKKLEQVRHELYALTEHKIMIQERIDGKNAPIKFSNPALVKSYEFFLHLYELPSYKELDPTWLMFITFPLFFGIMLGDVGYGLVTLTLFSLLRWKMPQFKALLNIMIFASLITIIFGVGYGEYFGFEHVSVETGEAWCDSIGLCLPVHEIHSHGQVYEVADFPRVFNRVHDHMNIGGMQFLSVLVIGFLVGVVHLNLALLIGFINIWKAHGLWHAILEKVSWFFVEAGVVLLVLAYAQVRVFENYVLYPFVGYIVLLLGAAMLYKGEGIQGIVELPAIFSNMLSYMRLGAVGLASVGLAVVVNEQLTIPYLQKGGWFILIGIFAMIAGHTINIGLGIIGPFLHSLRLHYVEFFSKFYKGGGVLYSPFGQKNKK